MSRVRTRTRSVESAPGHLEDDHLDHDDDFILDVSDTAAPTRRERKGTKSDDDVSSTNSSSNSDSDAAAKRNKSLRRSFFRRSFRRRGESAGGADNGDDGFVRSRLDPAFVEDIRSSLLEYSRIIKKRKGLGTGIYHVPETMHDWGQKQKEHHPSWSDLFFDLVYVGVLFLCGNLISDVLKTQRWEGFFYFYVQFGSLYECWALKLHYSW